MYRDKFLSLPLVTALLGLTTLFSQANDQYLRGDAFEHGNLAWVKASSAFVNGETGATFEAVQLFGSEFGSQEGPNGHYAFSDLEIPHDANDWVEWETLDGVNLTGYHVHLLTDLGRIADRITLMADVDGSGRYTVVDTFATTYNVPHVVTARQGLASENFRTITPIVAKRFRMEFQRDTNVFMNGIRVIEIDAVTAPNAEPPTIQITSPGFTGEYFEGLNLPVVVEAADSGGLARVELFANDKLVASSATQRSFTLTNLTAGFLNIKAKAIDQQGSEASDSRTLEVREIFPPTTLSSPRYGEGRIFFDVEGGKEGRKQIVFSSSDFQLWEPVRTNTHSGQPWTFGIPTTEAKKFYKVENVRD